MSDSRSTARLHLEEFFGEEGATRFLEAKLGIEFFERGLRKRPRIGDWFLFWNLRRLRERPGSNAEYLMRIVKEKEVLHYALARRLPLQELEQLVARMYSEYALDDTLMQLRTRKKTSGQR